MEQVDQVALFFFSAAALFLLNCGRGYGSVVGLFGQVFWLRTAIRSGQWGLVALSVVYAAAYTVGTIRWIRKVKEECALERAGRAEDGP